MYEFIGVDLPHANVLFDVLVHQWLGGGGFICFAVAVFTVTNQVDHHVFAKFHPKIQRQFGDERHCFRIVGVDMENRRLHHLRDVGAV